MVARNFFLDPKSKMPARAPHFPMMWIEPIRDALRIGLIGFLVYTTVVHNTSKLDGATASIDTLSPFGGLAAPWRWLVISGQYVSKLQFSNVVLGLGLLIGILFAGEAVCGWICPLNPKKS
ncbi:MAG: hypothetical protein HZB51_05125 [Chloroflexi bacterium]|nr:hypothetical protein [Chloroflexota bacterium]